MSELRRLEARRNVYSSRISEVYNAAIKAQNNSDFFKRFETRYKDLDDHFGGFADIHNQIISILTKDEEFEVQDKIRKDVDQFYYETKFIYETLAPSQQAFSIQPAIKLPNLNIPVFKGEQQLWPTFFDLFQKLIHENDSLANVQKFQYLLSYLHDEPLRLLSGIAISNDNYSVAFEKLIHRYQNKKLIASNALHDIMSVTLKTDSAKSLRVLLNVFSESLAILQSLSFNTDSWDFILYFLLLEKLDAAIRTQFEIQFCKTEIPKYNDLFQFLENRCKALESVQHLPNSKSDKSASTSNFKFTNSHKANIKNTSSFSLQNSRKSSSFQIKCYLCKGPHTLSKCSKFLEKSPSERNSYAMQTKLCINCLHHSHAIQQCSSSFNCRFCNNRHHSVLHIPNTPNQAFPASVSAEDSAEVSYNAVSQLPSTSANNTLNFHSTVLLATAVVEVLDGLGNYQPVRILIDSGSQSNFITEKCLKRLHLPKRPYSTHIYGLNQMVSFSCKGLTSCTVKSRPQFKSLVVFDAVVVPKLCTDMPPGNLDFKSWNHLKELDLADKEFYCSKPVDILVGAEVFTQILRDGRVLGREGEPAAFNTVFGWVLIGKVNNHNPSTRTNVFSTILDAPLEVTLQKFWETEKIPSTTFLSPEEQRCEIIYRDTVRRDSTGRFIVNLPFRYANPDLGDTYTQAFRRFSSLEFRLIKNPQLYVEYCKFMQDYIDCGHMTRVNVESCKPSSVCYLPHHCVLKPDSVTTKLRVVWDGSAKGSNNLSLNDTLLSGPKLQKEISSLLLIFRVHPIVFMADIKQMFRQILIAPEHRDFQRILWRFSPSEPLSEWTLNTVTFGLSCSPFLAMRTLNELADLEQDRFPLASQLLKTQIYIDDIIGTSFSLSSALKLQTELIELLKLGGFVLRKWASNSPELLSAVSSSDRQMPLTFDNEEPYFLKVLGLQWHPFSDFFSYHCQIDNKSLCTKRTILSDIGRIFDPLGFLSPIILFAKYLMQCLWSVKCDWDESPSPNIVDSWTRFKLELPLLSQVQLPRYVLASNYIRCELHGFSDASSVGLGAVVYLRVETAVDVKVSLVCAKSRVAPLKTVTLPKLELSAAKLLADLVLTVREAFSSQFSVDEVYAWSDSQVVLSWLKSSPSRWKPFVANRVSYIQEILDFPFWRYVSSAKNPADCASRGLQPSELLTHQLWWNGPTFLSLPERDWSSNTFDTSEKDYSEIVKEEKRCVLYIQSEDHLLDQLLQKYSSLLKIKKILAYCFRFQLNSKDRPSGSPNPVELDKALMCLIKHVQHSAFSEIISQIEKNQLLAKPFRKLSPFLDSAGFLRAGGRLRYSNLSYAAKHPLLLPSSHRLTALIIESTHLQYLHPGLKTLHNLLRQQYWILAARRSIEKTLSSCVKCFRVRPRCCSPPIMGNLPYSRISQLKPFSHIAIDFCGPFFVTVHRHRGSKAFKSYVCVFVCTSTRAIHLELAQELSTESFIAAFRRFIARRGNISVCFSDNGTNFVGANNQFFQLAQQTAEKLAFQWKFSPPSGPHFNGLAEAGVKMVKAHLLRVVGEQRFTNEEFTTLLCQIESILNSRPLCSQSSDPNDLAPLTPGHFLTLEPLNSVIPEPNLPDISRLSRWQLIQKLQADFWKRYSLEYLNTLQQRSKWSSKGHDSLSLNDLVIIKSDVRPPLQWSLGRVVELHPGADGITRVVTLRTARGVLKRPIVKLCRLPAQ